MRSLDCEGNEIGRMGEGDHSTSVDINRQFYLMKRGGGIKVKSSIK